jgi:hypothetical protein
MGDAEHVAPWGRSSQSMMRAQAPHHHRVELPRLPDRFNSSLPLERRLHQGRQARAMRTRVEELEHGVRQRTAASRASRARRLRTASVRTHKVLSTLAH